MPTSDGELVVCSSKAFVAHLKTMGYPWRLNSAMGFLIEHRGRIVTSRELAAAVWGPEWLWPDKLREAIGQIIHDLRHSLGANVHPECGRGYVLENGPYRPKRLPRHPKWRPGKHRFGAASRAA